MVPAFVIGFLGGIVATPHCLGMCGGFPLHLAGSSRGRPVARQLLFVAGKSFTYVFLGALAASLGVIVFKNTSLAPGAMAFRVAAGVLTLVFGLVMLGVRLPRIGKKGDRHRFPGSGNDGDLEKGDRHYFPGSGKNVSVPFFQVPGPAAAFVLGLGVGFLPCPLPMAMLAASAGAHNVMHGMALMAGVGLGTAPGLIAMGLFGTQLDRRFARVGMRAAGVLVILLGLLTIGRATGLIHADHPINRVAPPCCGGQKP